MHILIEINQHNYSLLPLKRKHVQHKSFIDLKYNNVFNKTNQSHNNVKIVKGQNSSKYKNNKNVLISSSVDNNCNNVYDKLMNANDLNNKYKRKVNLSDMNINVNKYNHSLHKTKKDNVCSSKKNKFRYNI